MDDHIIKAKVFDYAFDSKNLLQYCPGWEVEFNVTKGTVSVPVSGYTSGFERHLFWLRTPSGKWIMQFDRANSSSTKDRLFFCKDCGQPFDRLSDHGTHIREKDGKCNKMKKHVDRSKEEAAAEEEERLIAAALASEAGEEPTQEIEAVDPEVERRKAELRQKRVENMNRARMAKKAMQTQPEAAQV